MKRFRLIERSEVEQPRSRGYTVFLWVFSSIMILTAGSAFVLKLFDFFVTATTEGSASLGSFLIPVLNYLFVAGGFAFLFLWAYSRGQFRDVEAPKLRMLELNAQYDRLWEEEQRGGRDRKP